MQAQEETERRTRQAQGQSSSPRRNASSRNDQSPRPSSNQLQPHDYAPQQLLTIPPTCRDPETSRGNCGH